jgi:hypothetical protein
MSLADALLLEPCPLDVWIALRTDGARGSGTENDPYNGAPRYEPALTVTELAGSDPRVATATAANHGYSDNDVITISGATGADGKSYNGTFVIYGVSANTFQYWMAGEPAGDAAGTITCARTHYRFDEVLPTIAANTAIHLGPGVFLTRGYRPGETIRIKTRQKIIGSGMGMTTLKLVNASVVDSAYAVIGTLPTGGELRHFEVSDLTLDCNLDGQLIAGHDFAPIACAGITASGAHLRYRRVRVIHFGSLKAGYECFALWSAGAHPNAGVESVDCVIEDCIVEHPAINQAEMTTCIHMGSEAIKQGPGIGIQGYHRASVIRNCLVDCEFKFNPVTISQLTRSGSTATATTLRPHGRAVNDWVRIAGALVNGSLDNPFNGSFQITSATSTTFQYTMMATPAANASGDVWVDRFSSHLVPNTSCTVTPSGPNWIVAITTQSPHFRVPGNNVLINDAWGANSMKSFRVTSIPSGDPRRLECLVTTNPGQPSSSGFIGTAFVGILNDCGSAAIVEGNRIWNTRVGGPYHDTRSTKSLIVRNNHYRAVNTGPYQNLGPVGAAIAATSLTRNGTLATFVINSTKPHGFTVGQGVRIENAFVGEEEDPDPFYNGAFAIESVPTATSFAYRMTGVPSGTAQATPVPTVRPLWQVGEWVLEDNTIELIPSVMTYGPPAGIRLRAAPSADPGADMTVFRVFRRVIIRNNIIRYVDNLTEPTVRNMAIDLHYCEDALVENNVVDLAIEDPIRHRNCTRVRYFNNRTPGGELIRGVYDPEPGVLPRVKQDELSTLIEDAVLVCML